MEFMTQDLRTQPNKNICSIDLHYTGIQALQLAENSLVAFISQSEWSNSRVA